MFSVGLMAPRKDHVLDVLNTVRSEASSARVSFLELSFFKVLFAPHSPSSISRPQLKLAEILQMEIPEGVKDLVDANFVAAGSYGRVSRLVDPTDGTIVAVKVVDIERQTPKRIFGEVKHHRMCSDHPNVCKLKYSARGPRANEFTMVMEWADASLYDVRKANVELSEQDLECVAAQLLDGLACVHDARVIHGDVKTQNVLLTREGRLMLTDFGLSNVLGRDGEVRGDACMVSTVPYRAPELLAGQGTHGTPCDLWSVGCVLAELMLGKRLFHGPRASDVLAEAVGSSTEARPLAEGELWRPTSEMCARSSERLMAILGGGASPPLWSSSWLRFVLSLLKLDPYLRPTAEQARLELDERADSAGARARLASACKQAMPPRWQRGNGDALLLKMVQAKMRLAVAELFVEFDRTMECIGEKAPQAARTEFSMVLSRAVELNDEESLAAARKWIEERAEREARRVDKELDARAKRKRSRG